MLPSITPLLTDRQRAVMARIERRIPIKVIALELGVSESRINQHIRALKDIYAAGSLFELVENYRISEGRSSDDLPEGNAPEGWPQPEPAIPSFKDAEGSAKQITESFPLIEAWARDESGSLVIADLAPHLPGGTTAPPEEPQLVPKLLDGELAVPFRLLAILSIAACILVTVILSVNAAVVLSEVVDSKSALTVKGWESPVQAKAPPICYPACARPR